MIRPGQYGEAGVEAGLFAFHLRDHLPSSDPEMPPALGGRQLDGLFEGRPGWTDEDHMMFGHFMGFEDDLVLLLPADEAFDSEQVDLFDNLRRFHASLPFSEGERRWLIAAAKVAEEIPIAGSAFEHMSPMEGEIISAGSKQPIVGFDLIRRWVAWRRETDDFEGQGSLDEARSALDLVGRELLPEIAGSEQV